MHDIKLDETEHSVQSYCDGCDWVGVEHNVIDHTRADKINTRIEAKNEGHEHTATVMQ